MEQRENGESDGLGNEDTVPPSKRLIRGKYPAWRYPMYAQYPDIDPGEYWPEGRPLPEGFRLDKSRRIWGIALKKGIVAPEPVRCVGTCRDGTRCPNYKMKGRSTCKMHGAKQSQGVSHPNTITAAGVRHGIFGDLMPPELSEWFERAFTDPDLLNLTEDIATMRTRQAQLKAGFSTGETRADWKTAQDLTEKLFRAAQAGDTDAMNDLFPKLRRTMRVGRSDANAWKEIYDVTDHIRRLIDSERKRRHDMKLVVTAQQVRDLFNAYTKIVFMVIDGIPAVIQTLVRREGTLNTLHLTLSLKAAIGERLGILAAGMNAGRFAEDTGV